MLSIHDFLESNRSNNVTIQLALREIDTRELSYLMLDLTEEDQEIIIRNMSTRAAKLLREEMASLGEDVRQYRKDEAMEFFLQMLTKHTKYMARTELKDDKHIKELAKLPAEEEYEYPEISTDNEQAILDAFVGIRKFVRENGVLALQGVEQAIDDPVMRRGIEYYIDGWDPMLVQTIMEKYKKVFLKQMENRLDMILEGLDSLASKDPAMVTEERLKTFL